MEVHPTEPRSITLLLHQRAQAWHLVPLVHYLAENGWQCTIQIPKEEADTIFVQGLKEIVAPSGGVEVCTSTPPASGLLAVLSPTQRQEEVSTVWPELTIPRVCITIGSQSTSELGDRSGWSHMTYQPFSSDKGLHLQLCRTLSEKPLTGARLLVTGGSTPVPIDDIRVLTTQFTGGIALACAETLFTLGAEVTLLLGKHTVSPSKILHTVYTPTFRDYRAEVLRLVRTQDYSAAIFSAAVADYEAATVVSGKISSGQESLTLVLKPTPKVISEVKRECPQLPLITFKFEADADSSSLHETANRYLKNGSLAVVANSGKEMKEYGEHIAHIFHENQAPVTAVGKNEIALSIAKIIIGTLPLKKK